MTLLRAPLLTAVLLATACTQEGPGIYSGEPTKSCNEICGEQLLACNETHVWSTNLFGFNNTGGGQRQYRGSGFTRENVRYDCDEVPPDVVSIDGAELEGDDDYECACILNTAGDSGADAASPDGGMLTDATIPQDAPIDVIPDTPIDVVPDTPPAPGTYGGDIENVRSCEDVCTDEGLVCNPRNRWPASFPFPGDPGGCQGTYGDSTSGFGCYAPPPLSRPGFSDLSAYRCACINEDMGVYLLDDVEQSVGSDGVYQGGFTVTENASVSYSVQDNYSQTINAWTIAIVPSGSIDAYLAGEGPLVYGGGSAATVELPADDYALVLECRNAVSPCSFHTRVALD